jgi:hypothetical protein
MCEAVAVLQAHSDTSASAPWSHNGVALYLNSLRLERERLLRRAGSIWLFQSGKLFALLHRQSRPSTYRRRAQIAHSQ